MNNLRDCIASLVHSQWSHWMLRQIDRGRWHNGELTLGYHDMDKWSRQAHLHYDELSADEKESDLKWADKYLELLNVEEDMGISTWEVEIMTSGAFSYGSVFRKLNADFFQVYDDGRIVFYNGEREFGPREQVAAYAPLQWYGVRRKE